MIRHVHSLTVYVGNQNEALRFYRDVLGFEVRRYEPLGPAGSWIEVAPRGQPTALVLYPAAMQPDFQTRRPTVLLECDDVAALHQSLSSVGVTFSQEPTSVGWGITAMMVDPFGNELGLIQVTRAATGLPGPPRARSGSIPPPPPPPPPGRRR